MADEMLGLRKEPLFGRKERLYAAPAPEEKAEAEPPRPRTLPTPKKSMPVTTPAEPEDEQEKTSLAMRDWLSTAFELLGIASMTVGGFLLAPWVGWMILGGLLIVLGVATGYGA